MPSLLDMDAFMQGQSAQPSQVNTLGKPSNFGDIHGMIDEISLTEGVDPELVRALVKLESGFNPSAKNPGSSASGLMQLVKGTAAEMGVQDVFDPRQNLTGGIRYLKKHLDATGGDIEKALAMYNQGPAGDLTKARDYVETVKRFYGKNFTQTPTSGASPSLDISGLMDQYGIDPYPKAEPSSLGLPDLPNIPQEQPDAMDVATGIEESALGRGFSQALNSPQPEVGKLPFGVENKGGTVSKWAKDVLYGLPEGLMTLGAGLVGLPAAAIGGTAKAMTSGLEAGGDTFNEIAATSMGHPQTATAQYIMKPFEVIFGGILNSGAEVVKDLNPDATPEELDSKVKATQFVMNLAMVAPMFKGAIKGKGVSEENPAKSLDQHEVTPEAVEGAKAQVMADPAVAPEVKAQVGGVDVGVLQSIQKKAATSVAKERVQKAGVPEVKFPYNQSIVEGLLTEVELREGRAKTTMRKAATIVAQHEGDIALADLSAIKGINVKGSTGKAIARLIEERDVLRKSDEIRAKGVGDDVPMGDEAPVEVVKSLEDIPPKVEAEVPRVEESVVEAPAPKVDLQSLAESIDPDLRYIDSKPGIPGIIDDQNMFSVKIPGSTDESAFNVPGEVTREKVQAARDKIVDGYKPKIEEVIEDGQVRTEGREAPQEVVIPEFDDVKVARDEGYSFVVNKRFGKLEDAQAKAGELGEGHEVVKVGEKYRVAKFEETSPIVEFANEGAVNRAGLELMSEITADRVKFESPTVEEGFGLAKVGDKYYRTSPLVDMPERGAKVGKSQREPIVDGVSASDWEALKAFTDEATLKELRAKDTLKELANTAKLEEVKSPETNAALAQAFLEWRDSYVTKCNVARGPLELPNTKIVGADGQPIKMFHGTTNDLVGGKLSNRRSFSGIEIPGILPDRLISFSTSPELASRFANILDDGTIGSGKSGGKPKTIAAYLDVKNPFDFRNPEHVNMLMDYWLKTSEGMSAEPIYVEAHRNAIKEGSFKVLEDTKFLNQNGFDGVFTMERDALNVHVVDPSQIHYALENPIATTKVSKTPKKKAKPVTKESMAIVDDNFKTFQSMEAAQEWMESTGAVGELIPDPLTGKVSFMNTEKLKGLEEMDLWDEGVEQLTGRRESHLEDWDNPDMEMSDTGVRDLFSIFNNERGSVDVTSLYSAVDAVNKVVADAKKMGKSIDDYLAHIGADEVAIAAFKAAMARVPQMKQELREKDSLRSQIFHPDSPLAVPQTVKRNKNGEIVWTMPGITQEWATKLVNAPKNAIYGKTIEFKDPTTGKLSVHFNPSSYQRLLNQFDNPIYPLRAAGLKEIRHLERESANNAKVAEGEWQSWVADVRDKIPAERKDNYNIASWERMKGADKALEAMGIGKSEPLTPSELSIKAEIATKIDKLLDETNYSRVRSGQKAIPRLLDLDGNVNYLPLIRSINALADMGMLEGLTTMPLSKLNKLTSNFSGPFNIHALKRGTSSIPIELDVFKALEKYGKYAFRDIHMSPVAALIHEMATKKLPIPGQARKMSMMEWNPGMGKFLKNYSEIIIGKDPVLAALMEKNEWVGKALHGSDSVGARLAAAILGGSIRTVAVQPSMYLPNAINHLGLRSAGYGVMKLMADATKGKDSRYWKESSIANLREYGNDASHLQELMDRDFFEGNRKKAVEISMIPTKIFDSLTSEASWNAGIFHAEKILKLKGKDAVRFADDFVEMAQGMPSKGARSPVETSAATRLFTLLQSFGIADFNFLVHNVLGVKNPDKSMSKVITSGVKYAVALALVGEFYKMAGIENVVPDPVGEYLEAKKNKKSTPAALGMAALEFLEKVPILSNIKYASNLMGPVAGMGDMIPEALKATGELLDWKNMSEKQVRNRLMIMTRTAGYVYGIPMTNQILKSVNSYYKGGNPYQIIMGVYEEEKKKKGGLRPSVPRPPLPPKPF